VEVNLKDCRLTAEIDFKALHSDSTENKKIKDIVFVRNYAIFIREEKEDLHVINMKNPDDKKFIDRICTELYCTKDVVIGLYDDSTLADFADCRRSEWYELCMQSKIFYFDP